jgi:hypothetical protein
MKKMIVFMLCLSLMGCASQNLYPAGKTDDDWVKDELNCREKSGKITGVWALTWTGAVVNLSGANDRYNKCLRETGWLK